MYTPTARRSRAPFRRRSGTPPRSAVPALAPGLLSALLLGALLTGCSGAEKKSPPQAQPTPITRLNTTSMQLPRIGFCSLVSESDVHDALGTAAQATSSWGNGDVAALTPTTRDVVHELGCQWSNEAGAQARAWVFAQPVVPSFARTVVAASRQERGCRVVPGPAFGTPSTTQLCRRPGSVVRVRHAGLFGQTWLSCEVTREAGVPATEVRERADAWCVDVATALDAVS